MITNPTPITTSGLFGGMWITSIRIMLPFETHKGMLDASLLPYDGTAHLLAVGRKDVRRPIPHADVYAMVDAVTTEVKRQADTDRAVRMIHVNAPDPSKPVTATVIFSEGRPHFIPDCFALAGTDSTFAGVLGNVMATIAGLAGLIIE